MGGFRLTRWRADATLDDWGNWLYVQDRESGVLWSATYQPTRVLPTASDVRFYAHKAELAHGLRDRVYLEVAVAPDDDVEIRVSRCATRAIGRLALTTDGEVVVMAASPSD